LEIGETQSRIFVNGDNVTAVPNQLGYISLDRNWKSGDVIKVEFPFEARRVAADQRVREDRGKIAVERGPIVYCCEWPEVASGRVLNLWLNPKSELRPAFDKELYGGVAVIGGEARSISNPSAATGSIRLVPYYLWANRGAGEMSVWLSERDYAIGDVGPAGGLIFYENPKYAADGWRYLEAAPFDQSAGAKWSCFRRLLPGARGTAVGTGKQNTVDMLTGCTDPGSAAYLCAKLSVSGVRGWFLPSRDELLLCIAT